MARKKFPAAPVRKKKSARIAGSHAAKPPLSAHARLIHGFLVRLATKPTIPTKSAERASIAAASVGAPAQCPSDTTHEGPACDATFH